MMSRNTYGYFGSPRVVLSCCKIKYGYAVTAEADCLRGGAHHWKAERQD